MPTLKTPIIGSYNQRSFVTPSGKDQFFKAAIVTPIINKLSKTVTSYVEKRSGLVLVNTPSAGVGDYAQAIYASPSNSLIYTIFSVVAGATSLYSGTTNCGTIVASGGGVYKFVFSETILGGVTNILLTSLSSSSAGVGWYLPEDAVTNVSYTCDGNNSTTITDIKISGVNSVAGLYIGQQLSAASNIVAGSRIVSINAGAFSAVLDTATTGGAFNDLATTKEPVAKIIDADFPTDIVGGFAEIDGFVSIMTYSGRVYNSDLNTISTWSPSSYIMTDKVSDFGVGVFRYRNYIVAFSAASIEFLYNNGNATGSPFNSSTSLVVSSKSIPPFSMTQISELADGVLYWVGSDKNLYRMSNSSPEKITTIGTNLNPFSISSFVYNRMTFINVGTTSGNWWYCVDTGTWSDPAFGSATAFASYINGHFPYFVFANMGKVFSLNDSSSQVFQDNGSSYTMSIQVATDMGTNNRKFGDELRIDADVQSSGTLSVSWSDDDGSTFSTARTIDLTSQQNMRLSRIGTWKGIRLWKFEHSANTPFRIKMAEIDYHL